jgi:gluconate 5-dehydrogenase
MKKNVLITGVSGGIGQGLAQEFKDAGYFVIGLDVINHQSDFCHDFIQFDLHLFCSDEIYMEEMKAVLAKKVPTLDVLINNAAVQLLGSLEELKLDDWNKTMNVNLTAPLLLSQFFFPQLSASKGSIINIASIHQQLTKKRFISYATSKAALVGLTKSLSVDMQGKVRVNAISPAAIDTPMLHEGFNNDMKLVQQLHQLHPIRRIGTPQEVAKLALMLADESMGFINGANIQIDGGISNVLNDLK